MKSSPRTKRCGGAAADSAIEVGGGHLTIHIPAPCVLRVVARSVLLAAAILSFPWISNVITPPPSTGTAATDDNVASFRWVDDPFYLPMLLRDLRRERLIPGPKSVHQSSGTATPGDSNFGIFLGDPGLRPRFLKRNRLMTISPEEGMKISDGSIDFVLAADGLSYDSLEFVERVLGIGGIAVVRLSPDLPKSFRLPRNYRIVYIRWFGSTIVAIKKTAHAGDEDETSAAALRAHRIGGRRLLARPAPETTKEEEEKKKMKEVINGLEDAFLEPPPKEKTDIPSLQKRTRFLSDLIGGSLEEYPRRVFIDVRSPGKAGSINWFNQQYPNKGATFEIIGLDVQDEVKYGKEREGHLPAGISEWLKRNVREEEYVVMRAEAEVVEEMAAAKAAVLVDELFMECDNQWQNGGKRAYWECLLLFGRLRDEGVAVHQWWG